LKVELSLKQTVTATLPQIYALFIVKYLIN